MNISVVTSSTNTGVIFAIFLSSLNKLLWDAHKSLNVADDLGTLKTGKIASRSFSQEKKLMDWAAVAKKANLLHDH